MVLPKGSGSLEGLDEFFSPDLNTGNATFTLPIVLPPSCGVGPTLFFSYNSSSGNGTLGIGWEIPVPFISRQTDKGLPRYNNSDRFIYNQGQELVELDLPSDEEYPPGFEYSRYFRSRLEGNFMRFFYDEARDVWLVQDKDGTRYFFGESFESKITTPEGTFRWNLTRIVDVHETNRVVYIYHKQDGFSYLDSIYYNPRADDLTSNVYAYEPDLISLYQHKVGFIYESRSDFVLSYISRYGVGIGSRLERIEVSSYVSDGLEPSCIGLGHLSTKLCFVE